MNRPADATARANSAAPPVITRIRAAAPDRVAVEDAGGSITYMVLNAMSDRLAARLCDLGVVGETLVGVCLPRSIDRIVATLAVWKAGGALLVLDPAWPQGRIEGFIASAGAAAVITGAALAGAFDGAGRVSMTYEHGVLGAPAGMIEAQNAAAPSARLAYVLFTSGSTGEPKAVEIDHANLGHLIDWHVEAFGVTSSDRAGHVAGLGFDASIWEVWPSLCAGATLVLATAEETRTSPELLRDWLVAERITISFVPTVMAEIMIRSGWPEATALRFMLTGGEALHRRPARGLPFALINNYGPSECTVVSTSGAIAWDDTDERPSIGAPIARTPIYVCGPDGNLVDEGEDGEIFVGGAGVGRGYRGRPDLTAERFTADPFSLLPGARMYRTGDLGRFQSDGRIAFLGRADQQEKIRGVRIEPEEVAGVISRHPLIAWCAVTGQGSGAERQLVAYLLMAGEERPTVENLRAFLGMSLPAAMIPARFVVIDAVPLGPTGKLDRAGLPARAAAVQLAQQEFRAPASPMEARLAAIISDLLGGVVVGADDNFFTLGGHSLLGTQVILRAREAFGVHISLLDLFEAQTVAKLAGRIAALLEEALDAMTDEEAEQWIAS